MSKTPYEVRLELLNLAAGQLSQEFFAKRDTFFEHNKHHDEGLKFPSTDDIIAEATKYRSFVDKN